MNPACHACHKNHPSNKCPEVEKEIEERKLNSQTFIPTEYRRHRLRGLRPDQIDYDMCNIFR